MVPPTLNDAQSPPTMLIVELSGEIDLATYQDAADRVQAALGQTSPHLVVDLSRVAFIDSLGLSVLIQAYEKAQETNVDLHLVANTPQVTRPLRVTGLDQLLPVRTSLVDVLGRINA